MKSMSMVVFIFIPFFFSNDINIAGRWETKPSPKGNVTGVLFKSDNSFEGYINNKPFFSGTYSVAKDTFSFTDNGCETLRGVYRLVLFSNDDSLRFELISDDCVNRREGMKRTVLGRVKSKGTVK